MVIAVSRMDLCPSFVAVVVVLQIAAFVLDHTRHLTDHSFRFVADSAARKDWSIAAVLLPSAALAFDQWSSLTVGKGCWSVAPSEAVQ